MANPINPHDHGSHGHEDQGHGHDGNPQVSFERKDVNIVQITGFGIGLLLAFLVTVFAMWGLFAYFAHREDKVNPNVPAMMASKPTLPPEPRLQPEPGDAMPVEQLEKMHQNEEMLLSSYGWVDQTKGTVHIPIDQAIDMVAQKGLPVKVSPAGGDHDGYRMIPSEASSGRTLEKISQ